MMEASLTWLERWQPMCLQPFKELELNFTTHDWLTHTSGKPMMEAITQLHTGEIWTRRTFHTNRPSSTERWQPRTSRADSQKSREKPLENSRISRTDSSKSPTFSTRVTKDTCLQSLQIQKTEPERLTLE